MGEEISRLMDGEIGRRRQFDARTGQLKQPDGHGHVGVLPRDRRRAARLGRRSRRASRSASPRVLRPSRRCSRRAPRRQPAAGLRVGRRRRRRRGGAGRLGGIRHAGSRSRRRWPRPARAATIRARAGPVRRPVPADYLLAHQEYSPTTQIQGVGPYLRSVAAPVGDAQAVTAKESPWRRTATAMAVRARRCSAASACCDRSPRSPFARTRVIAPPAFADDALGVARAARPTAAQAAQLRRHHRLPARRRASKLRGSSISTTRGGEYEKLVNLDGPAREVIRGQGEVRCYYPDAKMHPHRAAHVPQRVPVAVAAAAEGAGRLLRRPQGRGRARGRARRPGLGVRAEGRVALRPQVLGRHAPPACCSRRASSTTAARSSSSSRSPTWPSARRSTARWCKPTWTAAPPDWQVLQSALGRSRVHGHGLDGGPAAAGLRQDRRRLPHDARPARAGRPPRLLGRAGRGLGVHRTDRRDAAASGRALAPGRHQRLHPPGRRSTSSPSLGEAPSATVRQIANSVARR